jgi:ectoine hydroxylase-related dioxygenase (phytanoyl-CoA dioxygenase family)
MEADQATQAQIAEVPLTAEQISAFDRDGYTIVREALDPDGAAELRRELEELFATSTPQRGDIDAPPTAGMRGGGVRVDLFSRYPQFREVFAQPKVLGALRSLLGEDFVLFPEVVAHDSRYGGWHKDTTPLERAGERFQWEPEFRIVECAFYTQDNNEYGGGLDVVPGTHHDPDTTPAAPKVTLLDRVMWKLGRPRLKANDNFEREGAISVPSVAGDLVIFHFRLDHRASQPRNMRADQIPPDQRKLALFFSAGANNELSRRYRSYLNTEYAHLQDGHSYPADAQEFARQHRITLL